MAMFRHILEDASPRSGEPSMLLKALKEESCCISWLHTFCVVIEFKQDVNLARVELFIREPGEDLIIPLIERRKPWPLNDTEPFKLHDACGELKGEVFLFDERRFPSVDDLKGRRCGAV
tara:strand:- start:192 stop:548 length:357 start_codon:yes stop_codon:yes gene_type:complete